MNACWDEVLDTMPEATLAVRQAAFRHLLLSGRAVTIEEVAVTTGLSRAEAQEAADLVASVGMAEAEEGTIFGMDGLTTRQTRHRLKLDGVELWTWCAYDIVGIAAALGVDASGETQCGLCRRRIEVVMLQGRPQTNMVVGWLPNESCSNVRAEFCPSALLFCSEPHLAEWRSLGDDSSSGEALDIESLAARGREFWEQLVPSA